jgi:nucleotide-binding universal stress UspA family protein
MKFQSYGRDARWHAEPAVLPVSSETGGGAFDHALLMSVPVEHLLAVTDFTECSNRAIARALERGSALGAQVTLLHVVEEGLPRKLTKLRQRKARELLIEHARSLYRNAHNDISVNVRTGESYLEIIREAIELGSDAIILGLQGHGFVDNKTAVAAMNVVHYGDKPVLMVARPPMAPYGHAVVYIDPFVALGAPVRAAQRLAPQAETHLVRIAPTAATRFGAPKSDPVGESGSPIEVLMDCVSQIAADLLVLGSGRILQHVHDNPRSLLRRISNAGCCDLLFVRNQ